MTYYRRSTVSDKVLSFIAMLSAVSLCYHNIQMYKVGSAISVVDVCLGLIAVILSGLFMYTGKMKYLEITQDQITWYTWFFVKNTLHKDAIKTIDQKKKYFIITKHKGMEVWLARQPIKKEDEEQVVLQMKKLIGGK